MQDLLAFMDRHERVLLHFSAGKDSAACLKLLRPWLDKVIVVWGCQGNPYPETVEYMQSIANSVPHFVVVEGQQKDWVKVNGYPVDILPFANTWVGALCGSQKPLFQSVDTCCRHNLWNPMAAFTRASGATGVVRGQRTSDVFKAPASSGVVEDGVEYWFPISSWTTEQVVDFLGEDLPQSYRRGVTSSLDCMDCTGFLPENSGKLQDLKKRHPAAAEKVIAVYSKLADSLATYTQTLKMEL